MNVCFTILGVLAISMIVGSYLAFKMSDFTIKFRPEEQRSVFGQSSHNSTLEDDLEDILAYLPLTEIKEILYDYLMYDKQIADTYNFINDQKTFIIQELERMPHTEILSEYLRRMGYRTEHWHSEVSKFWTNLPSFRRSEPNIVSGGLTIMIQRMLQILPAEDLHILLQAKARNSKNFGFLINLLGSPIVIDMCQQISKNSSLRRHYYWAMEAEIEATFALELAYAFYEYLTVELV